MTVDKPVRRRPSSNSILSLHNRSDILFVTACTYGRTPILATKRAARAIENSWEEADDWLVGKYVIMEDHVHFFCSPNCLDADLAKWMAYWKRLVTQSMSNGTRW